MQWVILNTENELNELRIYADFFSNPFPIVSAVGCRSNNDCADKQSCVKRECVNPCEAKICGRSERCAVEQHLAKCLPSK